MGGYIKKVNSKEYNSLLTILKQHLTETDYMERYKNLKDQNVYGFYKNKDMYGFYKNKDIYGFISLVEADSCEDLDDYVFNGYDICPSEKYIVLKSAYVKQDHLNNGIGTELGFYVLRKYFDKGYELFYTESWIKDKGKSSSDLLDKIPIATRVRYSKEHYSEWIEEVESEELSRECPGCERLNRNCSCSGAIYKIKVEEKEDLESYIEKE